MFHLSKAYIFYLIFLTCYINIPFHFWLLLFGSFFYFYFMVYLFHLVVSTRYLCQYLLYLAFSISHFHLAFSHADFSKTSYIWQFLSTTSNFWKFQHMPDTITSFISTPAIIFHLCFTAMYQNDTFVNFVFPLSSWLSLLFGSFNML